MMSGDWRYAIHRQHDTEVDAAIGLGGGECAATPFVGVKALMLAILEDAIRAYMGPLDRHHHEAVLWIIDARDPGCSRFAPSARRLGSSRAPCGRRCAAYMHAARAGRRSAAADRTHASMPGYESRLSSRAGARGSRRLRIGAARGVLAAA